MPALALSPAYQAKLLADPRYMSAIQGMNNGKSFAPTKGGVAEGIARALSGIVESKNAGDIEGEYAQKDKDKNEFINQAFENGAALPAETKKYDDGTSIDWQARPADFQRTVQALSQSPETSDIATTFLAKQLELQAANQMKGMEPLTPFQRLQLQTENQQDAYGNIIPKYSLDRAGGLPAAGGTMSPAAALTAPIGQPSPSGTPAPAPQQMPVGAVQPPAMSGTTDSTPTSPTSSLIAPPPGMGGQPPLQTGGTVHLPRTGMPKVDIEIMAKEAGANADLQKSQAETNQNAIAGAQGYLQKVGTMQKMLSGNMGDSLVGPIQGGVVGQTLDSMVLPENQAARERLAAQISGMELDVAKMQLKGQGSVTDAERQIARSKLNSLKDVNSASSLKKLQDLTVEATDMLRRAGYNDAQIQQTLKQYGVMAPEAPAAPSAPAAGGDLQAKIQQARAAGYSEAEIQRHLGITK